MTMLQRFQPLLLGTVLLLALVADTAGQAPARRRPLSPDSAMRAARVHEATGKVERLDSAIAVLGRARPDTAVRRHRAVALELRERIENATKMKAVAARVELSEFKISRRSDPELKAMQEAQLEELNLRIGNAELARAARMVSAGQFDKGAELYHKIGQDSLMPDTVVTLAIAAAGNAEKLKAKRENGLLAKASAQGSELATSLGTGALALLAVLLVFWLIFTVINHLPKKGTVLDVQDLTADKEQRDSASAALAEDIQEEVTTIARGLEKWAHDRASDLEGFASIRAAAPPLGRLERVVADGDAIKVGGLSFNPREILQLFATAFRRPYLSTLRGELQKENDSFILRVERVDLPQFEFFKFLRSLLPGVKQRTVRKRFRGKGANAAEAISDFARQYAFEYGQAVSTSSWQSFRDYTGALALLRSPEAQMLPQARDLLESAVRFDPDNWLARFKCAEVLRKLSENRKAIRHFEHLGSQIDDKRKHSPAFAAYLETNTDFEFIVDYNIAITEANIDVEEQKDAIRKLVKLDKELCNGDQDDCTIRTAAQETAPAGGAASR
jgi:tetratricopeptide (TPR) repeat protein